MTTEATFAKYIKQPVPQQAIWRYMDFPKFMSLLDSKSFFFCQAKSFDDQFEGVLPIEDVPVGSDLHNFLVNSDFYNLPTAYRATTVISCWSMNDYESDAMWARYIPTFGIAIKSTVQRLKANLELNSIDNVYMGSVHYNKVELLPGEDTGSIFYFFQNKRKIFEHEKEFRIAIEISEQIKLLNKNGGLYIPVKLKSLIETIVVSPKSPKWFFDLVESIAKKNNLSATVLVSEIDKKPL